MTPAEEAEQKRVIRESREIIAQKRDAYSDSSGSGGAFVAFAMVAALAYWAAKR